MFGVGGRVRAVRDVVPRCAAPAAAESRLYGPARRHKCMFYPPYNASVPPFSLSARPRLTHPPAHRQRTPPQSLPPRPPRWLPARWPSWPLRCSPSALPRRASAAETSSPALKSPSGAFSWVVVFCSGGRRAMPSSVFPPSRPLRETHRQTQQHRDSAQQQTNKQPHRSLGPSIHTKKLKHPH